MTGIQLSKSVTMHTSASSGTGTVAGVAGFSSIGFQISGVWAGLVIFEGTVDGENWQKLRCFNPATGIYDTEADPNAGDAYGQGSGTSIWMASCAGLSGVRTNLARVDSGTVTVIARITTAPPGELNEFVSKASVSEGGQEHVRLENDVLMEMLLELRRMNLHMQVITDINIEVKDIPI